MFLYCDYNKWNYEVIVDFVEGLLLNLKRLDEVIRVIKFVRCLFFFFYLYNNRFLIVKCIWVSDFICWRGGGIDEM